MSFTGIEFGSKTSLGGFDSARVRGEERAAGAGDSGAAESGSETGGAKSFGDFFRELVHEANSTALQADGKLQEVAAGRTKDLHGAVLAMEKADVQFRLLSQVRNKVIEAYREIMRMQV